MVALSWAAKNLTYVEDNVALSVLNPADHLSAEASSWYYGNEQEMQMTLRHTYKAWAETPGAIDAIHVLSKT
jgi:hypothetical protein